MVTDSGKTGSSKDKKDVAPLKLPDPPDPPLKQTQPLPKELVERIKDMLRKDARCPGLGK
jgi:hypothetical protein